MARYAGAFNKKESDKKKLQKRKEKEQRKEDRKAGKESKSFEDMLAYVDENGNLTTTPPDLSKKKIINESEIDLTSRNKGGSEPAYQRTGVVKYFDSSKNKGTYFHNLQKYHNQHQFGGEVKGFGVSSKFWDIVFRT